MDIRKMDKDQMRFKFQETDIMSFIQDSYYTSAYQANAKHVKLVFHSEVKELKTWIDPKNSDKVVLSLLSNTSKFIPKNGNIQIRLRIGNDPDVAGKALSHYFEISIEGSEIGINEAGLERISDRFYQIRNSQDNPNIGTDTGLHLTHSLVELHRGNTTVGDNRGTSGYRFIVRLPLRKERLRPEEIDNSAIRQDSVHITTALSTSPLIEASSPKTRSRLKYCILIVEDGDEVRRYICRELGSGFRMQECCNGKEVSTQILKKAPDLAISDIMVSEMDGMTLCSKVKQNIDINHISIIPLTAKSHEEDNPGGLGIGTNTYITKPLSIEILRRNAVSLTKSRERLRNNFQDSQAQKERTQKLEIESPDERLLDHIMKVTNDNIANPELSIEMVAETVGISRVRLHHKLKELTNQPTHDLIRSLQLKQTASLLASKRQSTSEITTLAGFTNVAYFLTALKKLYGMAPTAYMEQNAASVSPDTE